MNENNFASRVWWALIEKITQRAEETAGEKKMAWARGYHVYKDIWTAAIPEALVCSTEPTNVGKNFRCRIIFA